MAKPKVCQTILKSGPAELFSDVGRGGVTPAIVTQGRCSRRSAVNLFLCATRPEPKRSCAQQSESGRKGRATDLWHGRRRVQYGAKRNRERHNCNGY